MTANDVVSRVVDALARFGVPYMLVGSYSSNYYGRPRSTNDADFVAEISDEQISAVAAQLGRDFHLDRQMSFETITMTSRYVIRHPVTAFKVELFLLTDDPHDQARFARRQLVDFEGRQVWLPTPEDVIVTKLRWLKGGRRSKDAEDVAKVIAVQFRTLDLDYIRGWTDAHGTRELFEELRTAAEKHLD